MLRNDQRRRGRLLDQRTPHERAPFPDRQPPQLSKPNTSFRVSYVEIYLLICSSYIDSAETGAKIFPKENRSASQF